MAVSGTTRGKIVVWDESKILDLDTEEGERKAIKVIELIKDPKDKAQVGSKAKEEYVAFNVVDFIGE